MGQKYCSKTVNNLKEHTKLVSDSYIELAKKHGIETTNNAQLFYEVRTKHPEIELFDDSFHPSKYGSFLNACEFYRVFSGKDPLELNYIGDLDYKSAEVLKIIA